VLDFCRGNIRSVATPLLLGRSPRSLLPNDLPLRGIHLVQKPSYSRRALTRIPASEDIWLCWRCNGRDDVSRVLDISIDGLFIATPHVSVKEGMPAKLDFLVQEGRIKAEAVVRHVKRGSGIGLRFIAVADEDRSRLKALLSRLRSYHTRPPSQPLRALGQD
jgi:hypothetical protein